MARSLVGGVVVADHLSQDPLLVSVHGLHPRGHLVALFGHVVAAGRSRPAQRRGADGKRTGRENIRNMQHVILADHSVLLSVQVS